MFWTQEVLKALDKNEVQLINDSKTPSGEPHVGSLRGVLVHDAIFKVLKGEDYQVKYIFGSDDYDPVDEIPKGQDDHFTKYLGMPLCNVPPPPGSEYSDMAEHFISGFFKIFDDLGVKAEKYRMRDVYRSGKFNEAIEKILLKRDAIKEIYRQVSGSEKSDKWYPFQVICENCGRIGTTEVIDFDGKEVTYVCRPDLVKWATGCGHTGKMSPYDGNGKLPWKLEWVAKWMTWGITIEGAGMDHSTKGGSRDVSGRILREVFGKKPPYNVPYGFFLTEGAKMSSSKGIGATAREMNEFLAPEMLRYLMLSTPPKRAINFSPSESFIVKLYNDFDSVREGAFSGLEEKEQQRQIYQISELNTSENYHIPSFSLIKNLVQMPHIDIYAAARELKGDGLTELEGYRLGSRIRSAKFWLEHFATDEDKFTIQHELTEEILEKLEPEHYGLIQQFRQDLHHIEWTETNIQQQIFDSSRMVPITPKSSFKAMYLIFLNKDRGPQVGNLLYYLGRETVLNRLESIQFSEPPVWKACSVTLAELNDFGNEHKEKIVSAHYRYKAERQVSCIEFIFELNNGQKMLRRLYFESYLEPEEVVKVVDDFANKSNIVVLPD
ncbi:MAG: lysine--tRNA ligase [Saprospiraceae bacterium]|nr:lysine--tRNA ligase [Saprospiraceae bacterium]